MCRYSRRLPALITRGSVLEQRRAQGLLVLASIGTLAVGIVCVRIFGSYVLLGKSEKSWIIYYIKRISASRQAPFNITPDPSFLYLSASHREGLAQLSYGIRARKGFVVLTGEVGTGKTTLIHALLNDLNGSAQTALIFSTIVSPADLLRSVCEEFGLIEPKRPLQEIHDYLVSLNEFLLESYRKGENCALIIDEAQNLSAEVLESIRLLSNFETSKDKLLQILLVGQPELAVRLNSPELRQLKQRVMLRHHLRALSLQECCEYVSNRLKVAGAERTIFTPNALESIYSYSGGIPRIVNVLCDNALLDWLCVGEERN